MRDLKKEIENARTMIKRGGACDGIGCGACPIHYAVGGKSHDTIGISGAGKAGEGDDGAVRWLRGWLSLATGKPVKEREKGKE